MITTRNTITNVKKDHKMSELKLRFSNRSDIEKQYNDLSEEEKNLIIVRYLMDKDKQVIYDNTCKNFDFFTKSRGDRYYHFDVQYLALFRVESSYLTGDYSECSQNFYVLYNHQITFQFTLMADDMGSYATFFDGKQTITTGDLHQDFEFQNFKAFLTQYSQTISRAFNAAKAVFHVDAIYNTDTTSRKLSPFWITKSNNKYEPQVKYELKVFIDGSVKLSWLKDKDIEQSTEYPSIEDMIRQNQHLKK